MKDGEDRGCFTNLLPLHIPPSKLSPPFACQTFLGRGESGSEREQGIIPMFVKRFKKALGKTLTRQRMFLEGGKNQNLMTELIN